MFPLQELIVGASKTFETRLIDSMLAPVLAHQAAWPCNELREHGAPPVRLRPPLF
jgi:hypothetical protein